MKKVLTLDELAQQEDVSEYGKKTAGLVKLHQIIPSLDFTFLIKIPEMFAVPVNGLDSATGVHEAKEAYMKLTRQFKEPKIILARSSDPEEAPGRFETHSSLYDPVHREKSFFAWLDAAKRVHDSGARALIGQVLAANLGDFTYDKKYPKEDEKPAVYLRIPCFGGHDTGFVANSASVIGGGYPVVVSAFGLPSKIVRGDKEVCMMQKTRKRHKSVEIINLDSDYRYSHPMFRQFNIDIITLEKPEEITSFECRRPLESAFLIDYTSIPFCLHYYDSSDENVDFEPMFDLVKLIEKIKKETDSEIEIEGIVNEHPFCVYVFQLREYEMPQMDFKGLTEVPDKRKIYKTRFALGYQKFKGDLYVSRDLIDVPDNAIFLYSNPNAYEKEAPDLSRFSCLIIPMYQPDKMRHVAIGSHAIGQTTQALVELEKKGVKPIALGEDRDGESSFSDFFWNINEYPEARVEVINDNTRIFKNVTVECDGSDAQVYWNE